jgi:predicted cupin superfamily sugar epimerase
VPALTADDLIRLLQLTPHPEGGHFAEVFRSSLPVASQAHPGARAASTAIYFLLKSGELSALHRVRSDEGWHHYAGDALELHAFSEAGHELHRLGGDLARGERPFAMVPANAWQAARVAESTSTRRGFALVGCTVAPGFDFADFELPSRERMLAYLPEHADWVQALTRP